MSRRLSTRQQQSKGKTAAKNQQEAPESDVESIDLDISRPAKSTKLVGGVKAYITYEQREKSFKTAVTRKRASNAKKGSKTQKWTWPEDHPSAEAV